MPMTKPPYPAEFRQQLVELVRAGRVPAKLAREFNVSSTTIAKWAMQDAVDGGRPPTSKPEALSTAERQELAQPRTPIISTAPASIQPVPSDSSRAASAPSHWELAAIAPAARSTLTPIRSSSSTLCSWRAILATACVSAPASAMPRSPVPCPSRRPMR